MLSTTYSSNRETVQGAAPKSKEELRSSQTRRSSQPRLWSSATELGPPSTALHTLRAEMWSATHGYRKPSSLAKRA
jgi:hypothetical protein